MPKFFGEDFTSGGSPFDSAAESFAGFDEYKGDNAATIFNSALREHGRAFP